MNSNKRKDETLGMPHGTANGRLRKNILFHLLTKLKENICFKCGALIESVDDLSIEHKLPWEGRSAELFWDLSNIAFSHLHCNRPHRSGPLPRLCPEGFNWCYRCVKFKPISDFGLDKSKPSGFENRCKICKSEANAVRIR